MSVADNSSSTTCVGSPQYLVFFDLDNTLYRFDKTTINEQWIQGTVLAAKKVVPEVAFEDLKTKATDYHANFGMVPTGLARELGDSFDPVQFVKDSHTFTYDGVGPDPMVTDILTILEGLGHEMWVFTNGDMPHATTVADRMDIRKFFSAKDSSFRCVDIFQQWEGVPNNKLFNKPLPEAYVRALEIAGKTDVDPSLCVMVEDTLSNLAAPAAMGWKTIWLSYGRPLPDDATFTPTIIIDSFDNMTEATFLFE